MHSGVALKRRVKNHFIQPLFTICQHTLVWIGGSWQESEVFCSINRTKRGPLGSFHPSFQDRIVLLMRKERWVLVFQCTNDETK